MKLCALLWVFPQLVKRWGGVVVILESLFNIGEHSLSISPQYQGSTNATPIFLGEIKAYQETFEPDIISVCPWVGS